ncbi:hypothetical protein AB0K18_30325 [Nonomuraea sp. NPDC049421]
MDDLTEMLKGTLEGCVLDIIRSEELATFWAKWEYVTTRIDKLKEGGR